jgi:hypothetical protein
VAADVFSSLVVPCVDLGLGICFGPGLGLGLGFWSFPVLSFLASV